MPHTTDTGACDAILYCGMGFIMVGLVITVVGLGDKGFQSLELRLMGPIIVLCGVVVASGRIIVCFVPGISLDKKLCGCMMGSEGDRVGLIQAEVGLSSQGPSIKSDLGKDCPRSWLIREGELVAMIGSQQQHSSDNKRNRTFTHTFKQFHNQDELRAQTL